MDWSDHEYTNFVENILQIKQLQKIKSTLSWHTKLITWLMQGWSLVRFMIYFISYFEMYYQFLKIIIDQLQ